MRVVVTGMGIVSAAGAGVGAFREAIREGRPGDRPLPHLVAPEHQERKGAAVPVHGPDRGPWDQAIRLSIASVDEALAMASFPPSELPSGTALLLGTSLGNAARALEWHQARIEGRRGRRQDLLQAPLHSTTDRVARHLGLDGPRVTISNTCISGTGAIGMALDMIRGSECEVAVAGGVDTLHRFNFCGFSTLWALTNEECRPFDSQRTGMLLGEAAAFLILESEHSARRRGATPLAEVAGYGNSGDAVHITAPDREGGGAYRSIRMALEDAERTVDDVEFVSLHGTGTMYADGMEAAAMGRLFGARAREVPATSLRPVTGHPLGSAGTVDSIACVLAVREGFIPPTAHHAELDPTLPATLRIVTDLLEQPVRVAVDTSSGFGGSNASLVFERWEDEE